MSKILEIPLMETTINGNGRIYFHISENIKRMEFISNEFYQNKDRNINNILYRKYYEELVNIIHFIIAINLPINNFNKVYQWTLKHLNIFKTPEHFKTIDNLFLEKINLSLNDIYSITIRITFIFKDYSYIDLELNQTDKGKITNMILHNNWFEKREKSLFKTIVGVRY